ncbi:unnamed protein product [Dicrocoelium dendriticum]|nr:unnamed protein product [Dicrocoelium dendriticum]
MCDGDFKEYSTLTDWYKETLLFNALCKMKPFEGASMRSAFFRWRNNVRRRTYERQRQKLKARFIFANPLYFNLTIQALG